jgi:hypothetical protein
VCRGEETDVVPGSLLMLRAHAVLGRCLMIDLCILPTKSAGIRAHSKRSATPDPREAYGLWRLPPLSVVVVFFISGLSFIKLLFEDSFKFRKRLQSIGSLR